MWPFRTFVECFKGAPPAKLNLKTYLLELYLSHLEDPFKILKGLPSRSRLSHFVQNEFYTFQLDVYFCLLHCLSCAFDTSRWNFLLKYKRVYCSAKSSLERRFIKWLQSSSCFLSAKSFMALVSKNEIHSRNISFLFSAGTFGGSHERRLLNDLMNHYQKLERPVVNESLAVTLKFGLTLQQILDVVSKVSASSLKIQFWFIYTLYKLFNSKLNLAKFMLLGSLTPQVFHICWAMGVIFETRKRMQLNLSLWW